MFKPGDIICGISDKYSVTNKSMTMAYVLHSSKYSMNILYVMKKGQYLVFKTFTVDNLEECFSYKKDFNENENLVLTAIKKIDLFCIDVSKNFNIRLFRIIGYLMKDYPIIKKYFVKLVNQENTVEDLIFNSKNTLKELYGQINIYRR